MGLSQNIEGKSLVIIDIPRAKREDKPIFINNDILNGTYRRNGESDYRCSKEEVRLMLRDASSQPLDLTVLEKMSLDALCPDTIAKYRRRLEGVKPDLSWNSLSDEQFLYRLNAIGKHDGDGVFHLTVAGLLMFGYQYEIVKECPYYLLDYREETDPNTRWVDRVVSDAATWSGNVFDLYSAVVPKLEFALKVPFKLEGMVRVDDTPVHQAVRESLVNALVHANYYERQGVVIIKGRDFYTFSNPGVLRIPVGDAVAGGISDPRNLTVLTMFTLLNIGERAGTGLSNIYSVWKHQGWDEPRLTESFNPERATLRLMLHPITSTEKKVAIRNIGKKTAEQRRLILEYVKLHGVCDNAEICNLLGVKESRARILLAEMVEDSLLVAEGERKNRVYREQYGVIHVF